MSETPAVETFEQDGYKVELFQDYDPQSPAEWDTFGTFVSFPSLSRHYDIGHRESTGAEDDAVERGGVALLARYLRMTGAEIVFLRFEDYGSSGARLRVTGEDDKRVDGFIYADGEDIAKDFDGDRDKARACLEAEADAWNQYVEGDVYGYSVTRPDGSTPEDGSLWSIYGFEYAKTEAQSALADAIDYDNSPEGKREHLERVNHRLGLAQAEVDRIAVEYRAALFAVEGSKGGV